MKYIKIFNSQLKGEINIPSSKSATLRYLFASIFSKEDSLFYCHGLSGDIIACFDIIKKIKRESYIQEIKNNDFIIKIGKHFEPNYIDKANFIHENNFIDENNYKDKNDFVVFDCKDSAFCLRAASIILSAFPLKIFITGSKQLMSRPHSIIVKTIKQGKAKIFFSKDKKGFFIKGPLNPSIFRLDTNISTQHISGLFLTTPFLKGDSRIFLKNKQDNSYISLTLDILKQGGINIEKKKINKKNNFFNRYNEIYFVKGKNEIDFKNSKIALRIEADWSSASFFLIAGALNGPITFNNLNINSMQPDKKIFELLNLIGADIKIENYIEKYLYEDKNKSSLSNDSLNDLLKFNDSSNLKKITVQRKELKPFSFDIENCPDLFPSICVLAAFCNGESKISGIKRLKYKESNRIESVKKNFEKAGIKYCIKKDCFHIYGSSEYLIEEHKNKCLQDIANTDKENLNKEKIREDTFIPLNSFNDHRIFMAFMIFGAFFYKKIKIVDDSSYKKSYSNFLDDFIFLGGKVEKEDE